MKKDIHPKYYPDAQVRCSCGNAFKVGSTKERIEVEICSNCHPLYTGTQKFVDTAGRIDKFKARLAKKSELTQRSRASKKADGNKHAETADNPNPQTVERSDKRTAA